MDSDEFERRMRALEWFHTLRCLPGAWVVLRLDGRGFTKFTEREGFEKPFDLRFQDLKMNCSSSAGSTSMIYHTGSGAAQASIGIHMRR